MPKLQNRIARFKSVSKSQVASRTGFLEAISGAYVSRVPKIALREEQEEESNEMGGKTPTPSALARFRPLWMIQKAELNLDSDF